MNWLMTISFLVLVVSPPFFQYDDMIDSMNRAEDAYLRGDYQTSIALYESLAGINNPIVYFNLGNTYYESGDLGRALLNYRRAQQILPRDMELNQSLRRVLLNRIDVQTDETGFWEALATSTTNVLTLIELCFFVGILWMGWFAILGLVLLQPQWLKKLHSLIIGVGICVAFGLLLLGSRVYIEIYRSPAVVVVSEVHVMSGSGDEYLELYTLHTGAELYIWTERNQWVQFSLPDGRLGWLPRSAIEYVNERSPQG